MPKQLIVQYSPIRSCLVHLPPQWVNALLDQKKLPQNVILEISWPTKHNDTKKTYCGWSGEASKPLPPNSVFMNGNHAKLDVLEMDPQLGTAIGLTEGQQVTIEFCRNVADCASVHVEPCTEDDWEILELHAGYVEENLLSQIRVVYAEQLMCVWIHGRTLVRLKVVELDPKHAFVKLSNQSEVIVAPKVRQSQEEIQTASQQSQKQQQQAAPHVHLRTMPLEDLGLASVRVHPSVNLGPFVRINKVVPNFARREGQDKKEGDNVTLCKAMYCAVDTSKDVPPGHMSLNVSVRSTLDISDFDIVKVSSVTSKKTTPGALVVRCFTSAIQTNATLKLGLDSAAHAYQTKQKAVRDAQIIDALREVLCSKEQAVLTHGMTVDLPSKGQSVTLQFGQKRPIFSPVSHEANPPLQDSVPAEQFAVMTRSQLQSMSIELGDDIPSEPTETKANAPSLSSSLGGIEKVFHKLLRHTLANVAEKELKDALAVPGSGGILITGAHGAGKTSLARRLIQTIRTDRHALTYTLEVNCAEIADERVPTFKEMLQTWFDKAAWHAPSLIFFDDLDRLIPAEVEHADSSRSRHLAELFTRTALTMTKRHAIMVVATSQQQQSVHPALITHHVFSELKHLNPPSRNERKEMLHAIMTEGPDVMTQALEQLDLVSVASETEGFLAADLKALVERAVHEGAVRSIKQKMDTPFEGEATNERVTLTLNQHDFSKAREGFVPSSLRGVKLQQSSTMWTDIGGLNETRRTLLETLEWPTKYAAVFSQCPLRLRSGLLLYGYPGCGKTLLASAVAKECGLNFISVKGPEILNKYIGASEKSVRDLFDRAQAAKPCVLFFDEFDAIAPRRGHDSTGVTDRVVNQMLTQMDGAEGLDGVYVLAATSRPDLIDPALLRPGRLDKALLCGMPGLGERMEILEALARKMTLAPDVDLRGFAEKTEGYSGADLQGFLYNAHLEAIHGAIQIDSFRAAQSEAGNRREETTKFVLMGGTDATRAPLTSAERAQIAQRLALIKKGSTAQPQEEKGHEKEGPGKREEEGSGEARQEEAVAVITAEYLSKSLAATRPSITVDERVRLQMIYDEFVTGRTGELPSGEGAKGVGKRTTLG